MSYPDPTLNTTYTYDTGAFGKGRLTGITRHGEILAYTYDRFGRFLQNHLLWKFFRALPRLGVRP